MMAPYYNIKDELLDSDDSDDSDMVQKIMKTPTCFGLLPRFCINIPGAILWVSVTIPYVILLSLWWSLMFIILATFTLNQIVNICHLAILRTCAAILEIMNRCSVDMFVENRVRTISNEGCDTPYLTRYYLFIKHQQRGRFPFNIFFHKFHTTDEKKEMHDHPWVYFHIILSGGYWEHLFENDEESCTKTMRIWRGPGYWNWIDSRHRHRIELEAGNTKPWTLFIPFKREFHWGFWAKKEDSEWFEKEYHEKFFEKKEK